MIYSPIQKTMAKYLNSDDPKCLVINGKDFIYHFITSNFKSDTKLNKTIQEYAFFEDKNHALDRANDFFEVLGDLSKHKIIKINKDSNRKHIIKFILKEPQQNEHDFIEFHELFDEYVTADFDIIDQNKFDRFIKQNFIHDKEFTILKIKKRNKLYTTLCLIVGGIGALLTLYFGIKALM